MAVSAFGSSVAVALLMLASFPGCTSVAGSREKHTLYLLSILPYNDTRFSVQPAFDDGPKFFEVLRLAIEHINNETGILDDYNIELIEGNGGCDLQTLAMETLVRNVFHSGKQIVGIIGPGCSDSAVAVSDMCGLEDTSLITIHLGTAPLLADRDRFPYAFSLPPTSLDTTKAAVELTVYNNWKTVAVIHDASTSLFIDQYQFFEEQIDNLVDYQIAFSGELSYPDLTNQLKESFARIIVAFVGSENICKLVCLASHEGLIYPSYQWVLVDTPPNCYMYMDEGLNFTRFGRKYDCTFDQLLAASEGMINIQTDCHVASNFLGREIDFGYKDTCIAGTLYDGVRSLALALNSSIDVLQMKNLNLSEYHYGQDAITRVIQNQLYEVDYCGVTGRIKYNRTTGSKLHSRILLQVIDSYVHWIGSHEYDQWYISSNATFLPYEFPSVHIHVSEFVTVICLLFSVGITALVCIAHILTVVYRNYDSVRASSPRLNHFVYGGCYAILLSVSVYTLINSFQFGYVLYSVLCNVTSWSFSIGSTLILATVCVKTWRLYDIFVLSSRHLSVTTKYSDRRLAASILILLVADVILVIIWSSVDALVRKTIETIDLGGGEPRIEVEYQCYSESIVAVVMMAVLTLYKIILLTCSTCLAFLTRRIRIKRFQTTYITRFVYSICLVCGLGLPVYFITEQTVNKNISFTILCTVLNTLVILCFVFLFVPPLWPLLRQRLKQKRTSQLIFGN